MCELSEYSNIWKEEKDKYILLDDERGKSVFFVDGEKLVFLLVEDDSLFEMIVQKMLENGNIVYSSFEELKRAVFK